MAKIVLSIATMLALLGCPIHAETDAAPSDSGSPADSAAVLDSAAVDSAAGFDTSTADRFAADQSGAPDSTIPVDAFVADGSVPQPDGFVHDSALPVDGNLADTQQSFDTARPDTFVAVDAGGQSGDAAGFDPNTVELFGFGDSVTDGFCASPGRDFFSLLVSNNDSVYPAETGNDLRSHFAVVNPRSGYNQAISATTSCDWEDRSSQFANMMSQFNYANGTKLMVITLGGNDLIHDYSCSNPVECGSFCSTTAMATPWAANFKTRMIELIELVKANMPGPLHIFLANIYDPTDGVGDIENALSFLPAWPDGLEILEIYNQKITEVCQATGAHCVDMRGAMLGHGIHNDDPQNPYYDTSDPTHWYCSNIEDPNDRGYHAIRKVFWAEIARVLGL